MKKMEYNLDFNIKNMLGNLELIPEMVDPKSLNFFGEGLLNTRTAKVYQLLCNISTYHETTADAINWLCFQLNVHTDINELKISTPTNIYTNIKSYIWDSDNKDEDTGAFFIFENKLQESKFLNDCLKIRKYQDVVMIGINYGFDIYEVAELLMAAAFEDCTFNMCDRTSEFERPLIASIVYAKFVSMKMISVNSIRNLNKDNYE